MVTINMDWKRGVCKVCGTQRLVHVDGQYQGYCELCSLKDILDVEDKKIKMG